MRRNTRRRRFVLKPRRAIRRRLFFTTSLRASQLKTRALARSGGHAQRVQKKFATFFILQKKLIYCLTASALIAPAAWARSTPSAAAGTCLRCGVLPAVAGAPHGARVAVAGHANTAISRLLADVEHITGCKTVVTVALLQHVLRSERAFILKRLFVKKFSMQCRRYKISARELFDLLLLFAHTRDAEALLSYFCENFNKTRFSRHSALFLLFTRALQYVWPFFYKTCGARGIYILYGGKLSRHLLAKSRQLRLIVGKTGISAQSAVYFAYKQTHSDTGAFGLTLYYYTAGCDL